MPYDSMEGATTSLHLSSAEEQAGVVVHSRPPAVNNCSIQTRGMMLSHQWSRSKNRIPVQFSSLGELGSGYHLVLCFRQQEDLALP